MNIGYNTDYYLAQGNRNSESKISRRLFSTSIGHRPMYLICSNQRSERALSNIASVLSGRRREVEHLSIGRCPMLLLEDRCPSAHLLTLEALSYNHKIRI